MSRPVPEDVQDHHLSPELHPRQTKRLKTAMMHSNNDTTVDVMKMEVDSFPPVPSGELDLDAAEVSTSTLSHLAVNHSTKMEVDPKTTNSSCQSSSGSSRDESSFQKLNKLQKFVPYAAHLTATREELWANLQKHMLTAIASQGQPLLEWTHAAEQ